eukprot:RCo000820
MPRSIPKTVEELMGAKLGHVLLALGKDKQQIAVCSPTTTVGEALKTMAERCTLSLPILNDPVQNKFVGFVDVMSLLRALMISIHVNSQLVQSGQRSATDSITARFTQSQLKDVLPLVEGNADSCVSPSLVLNATFKDALIPFTVPTSEREWHVHRLLITTNDGRLAALFTQSDAVQLLARNTALLGDSAKKTLSELNLTSKAVVSVPRQTSTLEALRKMIEHGVTSVAVLSDDGRITDVLSSSDLRGLQDLSEEHLTLSIPDFKQRPGSAPKPLSVVMCHPDDTLESAVCTVASNRLHRIYICTRDTLSPVGVITLTDILTILVRCVGPSFTAAAPASASSAGGPSSSPVVPASPQPSASPK